MKLSKSIRGYLATDRQFKEQKIVDLEDLKKESRTTLDSSRLKSMIRNEYQNGGIRIAFINE